MNVSSVASALSLAESEQIAQKLSAAVARQIIVQEKQQGQAIVEMVKQSNIVKDGHVDIRV
jgi:hypothetical protein